MQVEKARCHKELHESMIIDVFMVMFAAAASRNGISVAVAAKEAPCRVPKPPSQLIGAKSHRKSSLHCFCRPWFEQRLQNFLCCCTTGAATSRALDIHHAILPHAVSVTLCRQTPTPHPAANTTAFCCTAHQPASSQLSRVSLTIVSSSMLGRTPACDRQALGSGRGKCAAVGGAAPLARHPGSCAGRHAHANR